MRHRTRCAVLSLIQKRACFLSVLRSHQETDAVLTISTARLSVQRATTSIPSRAYHVVFNHGARPEFLHQQFD